MGEKKTILVTPLHWGLGHATRCIPIIKALLAQNFKVLLASDGAALLFLQKEFPTLSFIELPAYHIHYPNKGKFFFWTLFFQLPRLLKSLSQEKKIIKELVRHRKIDGIISDNRPGCWNSQIPTAYITHQLKVFSGPSTVLSSYIHQYFIKKFDACWVPDTAAYPNLSGAMGHLNYSKLNLKYMGALSRMQFKKLPIKYDILAVLSGPEPQRSLLETILIQELRNRSLRILLVQGIVESEQKWKRMDDIEIVNFMESGPLENTLNESELVISRSGYTTIMDLAALHKKAFLIPTPGQFEQEYLAKRLMELKLVASCKQSDFSYALLKSFKWNTGWPTIVATPNYRELLHLFRG